MIDTPNYSVIKKEKDIELRIYGGYIQAEVDIIEKDNKSAIENGCNILTGYIFGNNVSRQKIKMSAPVEASQSQKIAMTTPVKVKGDIYFAVAFIMSLEYTLKTLPIPKDNRIRFTLIPAHRMATTRFSGYLRQKNIRKNKERLCLWLRDQKMETEGNFIVAGYNPPWIPGFMAQNEVLIKIKTQ